MRPRPPWLLTLAAAGLVIVGCLAIARADELLGTPGRFLGRQLAWVTISIAVAVSLAVLPYQRLATVSYLAAMVSTVLLVLVFWCPAVHGARRWIPLGPANLQPSEMAKLTTILALARYLMYRDNYRRLGGLMLPLLATLLPVVLILREPDLGTSLVFLPIPGAMLIAAGARRIDLAKVSLVGLALCPVLWGQMSSEQRSRVTAMSEQNAPNQRPTVDGYQLHQAKSLRAAGGVWGSWVLGSQEIRQGAFHLPAAQTDFVFAVIGERFGLVGGLLVLAMYGVLVRESLRIAARTREPFGRLIAVGCSTVWAVQATVNVAMNLGVAPVTGLSLPWVSHGGSGLVASAAMLGWLWNMALHPRFEVTNEPFLHRSARVSTRRGLARV